jgi:hypothetical protein
LRVEKYVLPIVLNEMSSLDISALADMLLA